MISVSLYFENGLDLGNVVNSLQELPLPVRPVYFSENDERPEAPVFVRRASRQGITFVKINLHSDEQGFVDYQKDHPSGFVLYSENDTVVDLSSGPEHTTVAMYLENHLSRSYVNDIFSCLVRHKPVFGYASDASEYDHRHRHCITIDKNRIESWIGRSLQKYITGVYWYTLLSDDVLEKHGVVLSDLSSGAITVETFNNGSLHLLKFYNEAEEWRPHAERLDGICEKVEGIFSRRTVDTAVAGETNFLEYCFVSDGWC